MFHCGVIRGRINTVHIFFRQPVTKKLFRHYRVLGKGGFGEVGGFVKHIIVQTNMKQNSFLIVSKCVHLLSTIYSIA